MQLQLSTSIVEFYSVVTYLGVVLDSRLSMGPQATDVSRSCFTICVSYVSSNDLWQKTLWGHWSKRLYIVGLDYCSALLVGVTDTQIKQLESVQNIAARLVSGTRRRNHSTPDLRILSRLFVRRRIIVKTAVLVWKCIHGVAPPYLQEFCVPVEKVQIRPWLHCGRHRLDVLTCQEYRRRWVSKLRLPRRSCGVSLRFWCRI